MARIRSIKPEFWSSAQNIECSPIARLLFIGLWNFCDDKGRHALNLKTIKAEVFPGDEISLETVRRLIDELAANELIAFYAVDGKEYFYVTGWHHQKIDKPQKPKCPDPDGPGSSTIRRMFDDASSPIGEDTIGTDPNRPDAPNGAPTPPQDPPPSAPPSQSAVGLDLLGKADQLLEAARATHLRTRLQCHHAFQAKAVAQLKEILDDGANFDADVLPAVRAIASKPGYDPRNVGSISYFRPAVARAREIAAPVPKASTYRTPGYLQRYVDPPADEGEDGAPLRGAA